MLQQTSIGFLPLILPCLDQSEDVQFHFIVSTFSGILLLRGSIGDNGKVEDDRKNVRDSRQNDHKGNLGRGPMEGKVTEFKRGVQKKKKKKKTTTREAAEEGRIR